MDRNAIKFVLAALPQGRTVFYSFPDRYALLLLQNAIGSRRATLSEIRSTRFAPLLEKPSIKKALGALGRSSFSSDDLQRLWPAEPEAYRLTLGTWPSLTEKPSRRWDQVTRTGWSLVLQLNVSNSHRRTLSGIVDGWEMYNDYSAHPIARGEELTLAWARIDLDFESGEALIEEIQSDWIRDVRHYAEAEWLEDHQSWGQYLDLVLRPQAKKWPQTMLTATLWFLLEELGIRTIFFHTYKSGIELKNLRYGSPPKSLYTELPRRFCFAKTHYGPIFIRDAGNRALRRLFIDPATKWYIHDFSG